MARSFTFIGSAGTAWLNELAAADWIDRNQLGRRNLTPDQYSLLRGRRYSRMKKRERGGGDRRSEAAKQNRKNCGNDSTAERLAIDHGVSPRTIEYDARFAAAIADLKAIDPDLESKVVAGLH